MTEQERKQQEAAIIAEAARITGKPAADLTPEQAEAVLFHETGRTILKPDPAGTAAQRMAKKEAQRNSRRAQNMTKGKKPARAETLTKIAESAQEVQKPTQEPEPAAEQEAQEPTASSPEGIAQRIHALSFMLDYMKSPEDALLSYNLPGAAEMYDNWSNRHFARLVMRVAQELNADPAQIADKNRRTPEQQDALLHAAAREQLARFDAFFNSNYMQAMGALEPIKGKYPDPEPQDDYSIKELAALYFFALHFPDLLPHDAGKLTGEQLEEVKAIFSRIDAYFNERTNGGETERQPQIFLDFVKADSPEPAHTLKLLPRIIATPPDALDYPIDKINKSAWDDLANAPKNSNGQIMFATEKRGSRNEATILYSIDFNELEKLDGLKLSKKLTTFDKWVYIAASALYAQNGQYMSAGQIYTAMGNRGKPAASQIQKINDSLTKMGAARVYLDNSLETPVNKKYPKYKYDGALLPFERVSAYINNALVESAVHLFREPPLMTFAKERRQITTISRTLLEIPLSKTEDNLQLMDYLIDRIASMKRPGSKISRKILFATIYEKCKIEGKSARERQARSRTPRKIKTCLEHFKEQGHIKGYKEAADGITIEL